MEDLFVIVQIKEQLIMIYDYVVQIDEYHSFERYLDTLPNLIMTILTCQELMVYDTTWFRHLIAAE